MNQSSPNQPDRIGRYEIIKELGRGGMATVYLSRDPQFNREIAVKVLPREFTHNPHFKERFEREARAIAQLEHSAIVPVYDYGEDGGRVFLVMRMMRGGSLSERIVDGPLPLTEAADILDQIATALDVAHQRGIIHRDVKPANILFDEHGDAFVSDFGLVKMGETASSLTGSMIVGTPAYMAPEMSQAGGLTSLVDVYALGITLFQMVTGTLPYEADTPLGTMLAHAVEPIPDIDSIAANIPADVARVIRQGMAKQPANRYQTTRQLATDFRNAVEGKPLQYHMADTKSGITLELGPNPSFEEQMAAAVAAADTAGAQRTKPQAEQAESSPVPLPVMIGVGGIVLVILLLAALANGDNLAPPAVVEDEATATIAVVAEQNLTEEPNPTTAEPDEPAATPTDLPPTAEPVTPTPIPAAGLLGGGGPFIVYQSDEPGNNEIYLRTLDGADQYRLTNEAGPDGTPVWSPDGTRIAFVSRRAGNQDIYVLEVEGTAAGEITQVTTDPRGDFDPAWSPDGTRLAFVSGRDGNNEIYVLELATGEVTRLTENRFNDVTPTWSPDGTEIAFSSNLDGNLRIFIMSSATGTLRRSISQETGDALYPAWSPNGGTIAYASNVDQDWDIYLVDVESGEITPFTENNTFDSHPAWSPDGAWLVYSAGNDEGVEQRLVRAQIDGTDRTDLTFPSTAFSASFPAWQPAPPQ